MNPATMSAAARRSLVEASEGERLVAYRDCVGVLTIGYGHTSRAGEPAVASGMRITAAEADEILSRDLAVFERGVAAALGKSRSDVTQNEFDALVSLAFNIGLGAFRSSSLLRAYVAGDKTTAARKFLDWNKAGGRVVAGLAARRTRERDWFLARRIPSALSVAQPRHADLAHRADHPDPAQARFVNLVTLQGADIMKGYRTISVGLALAIGPAALQYLGAVDWATLIGPTGAFFVSGLIAIFMRAITSTPVGKPDAAAAAR